MVASGMRFSRSSPLGTRRRCPKHSTEPPEHAGWSRRARRPAHPPLFAGYTTLATHHDGGRPQHAHDVRAERVGRDWVGPDTPYSSSLPAVVYVAESDRKVESRGV